MLDIGYRVGATLAVAQFYQTDHSRRRHHQPEGIFPVRQATIKIISNFNRDHRKIRVKLPGDLLAKLNLTGKKEFTDLLSNTKFSTENIADGVEIDLPGTSGMLLKMSLS